MRAREWDKCPIFQIRCGDATQVQTSPSRRQSPCGSGDFDVDLVDAGAARGDYYVAAADRG
jgi:hypothetical protein